MTKLFSKSTLMAIAVGVTFILWMLSGNLRGDSSESSSPAAGGGTAGASRGSINALPASERPRLRVSIVASSAEVIDEEIVVSARTEPNRSIELRAEAEGRVVELSAERGALVGAGDRIARLDIRNREARRAEITALLEQHQLQFEAAQQLRGQGLLSEVQIAEARARLAATEAALASIEIEIAHTLVTAPFDAIIQERSVELGDFVKIGDSIAALVDTDPLIVAGTVSEQEVKDLSIGSEGSAELVSGEKVRGKLRYVAPQAESSTRTFRVELAVPNPHSAIRAGLTAELRLTAGQIEGHLLSPALLTLDDDGTIGVKTIDQHDRVRFDPVKILRSTEAGIWVAGLPQQVRIISIGQGFVVPGELVEPVLTEPSAL